MQNLIAYLRCNKGKNRVLPLVFCLLSSAILLTGLTPVAASLRHGAAPVGFVPASSVPSVIDDSGSSEQTCSLADFGGMPESGAALGSLSLDGTGVDCTLFYGDADEQLEQGAGLYTGSHLPGQGSLALIGGHTNSFFRGLEKAQIGGSVRLSLFYGEYVYQITDMRIVDAEDASAYDLNASEDQLILYTCYPFGVLYETPYRYFVYATKLSGPVLTS